MKEGQEAEGSVEEKKEDMKEELLEAEVKDQQMMVDVKEDLLHMDQDVKVESVKEEYMGGPL